MPEIRLKNALRQGLRSSADQDRNDQFLTDAYGVRPTRFGASIYEGIIQPLTKTVSHPFPQLFVGSRYTLLMGENTLSELSYTYSETSREFSRRIDYSAFGSYTHVNANMGAGGGPWHFADLDDAYFLCNGKYVVVKVPGLSNGNGTGIFISSSNFPLSCCELNGRVIFGGMNAFKGLMDVKLASLFDNLDHTDLDGRVSQLANMDDSFVWWSSIGYEDAYWPFFGNWMMDSAATINQVWQRNEFGFARVPWQDTVWCVKPLGNGFVAYGEHGVAYFKQNDLTFGMEVVATFGTAGRGSIGGNRQRHLFVSTEGALWQLTADLQLTRLGYEELLEPLLVQPITVSYNEQLDDFYIGNATSCYVKTPAGMAQTNQLVTSIQMHRGNAIGMYEEAADTEIRILTDIFDFGSRNIKTVNSVQLASSHSTDFSAILYFRNDSSGSFRSTSEITAQPDGRIQIGASAVEFMLRLKAATSSSKNLEDAIINYSEQSKRKLGDWLT